LTSYIYNSTLIWSCLGGKKGIVSTDELKLIDILSIDLFKHLHGVDATQAKVMPPYKVAKGFACCNSTVSALTVVVGHTRLCKQ